MEHRGEEEQRLKSLIDKVNREARSDELTSREREIVRQMIEERARQQWLMKRIWAFLLAGPAMFGVWQVVTKIVEWIRGQ